MDCFYLTLTNIKIKYIFHLNILEGYTPKYFWWVVGFAMIFNFFFNFSDHFNKNRPFCLPSDTCVGVTQGHETQETTDLVTDISLCIRGTGYDCSYFLSSQIELQSLASLAF